MFDIGIGELLVLAVVGLLVFGPDRLPKAAAQAGQWLRRVREMGQSARQDLVQSAGIDLQDTVDSVRGLRDLHPRRLAANLLSDDGDGSTAPDGPGRATQPAPRFDPDAT
jgi:sec-independent protein translocase protein TatB